jgi:hypothetical protein
MTPTRTPGTAVWFSASYNASRFPAAADLQLFIATRLNVTAAVVSVVQFGSGTVSFRLQGSAGALAAQRLAAMSTNAAEALLELTGFASHDSPAPITPPDSNTEGGASGDDSVLAISLGTALPALAVIVGVVAVCVGIIVRRNKRRETIHVAAKQFDGDGAGPMRDPGFAVLDDDAGGFAELDLMPASAPPLRSSLSQSAMARARTQSFVVPMSARGSFFVSPRAVASTHVDTDAAGPFDALDNRSEGGSEEDEPDAFAVLDTANAGDAGTAEASSPQPPLPEREVSGEAAIAPDATAIPVGSVPVAEVMFYERPTDADAQAVAFADWDTRL